MAIQLNRRLLVIDDDPLFCDLVSIQFSEQGVDVLSAHSGAKGKQLCTQNRIDVVLLDQKLPDIMGQDLCRPILAANDRTKIIFITAYPSFDHAVAAIKAGAYDYLSKPFENEALLMAVEKAFRAIELEQAEQIQNYRRRLETAETVLIGSGTWFEEIQRLMALSASSDAAVLITGETGTGKNIVAKSIHYMDRGQQSVFMEINCATLPENLIEAELFGHEKGAFTGAHTAQKGIIEMAEGGTLFLDEIGDMPLHLQTKLLSVLDTKKIRRVGGRSLRPIDVRIIAATNTDLEKAIVDKTFREDLFYRLSVIRIHIPPLKERRDDIPDLAAHFIRTLAATPDITLPAEEVTALKSYSWPGNVRELRNIIERALLLRENSHIFPSRLLGSTYVRPAASALEPLTLEALEYQHIRNALDKFSHNHTRTAEALGISRSTLIRKMKKYDLH